MRRLDLYQKLERASSRRLCCPGESPSRSPRCFIPPPPTGLSIWSVGCLACLIGVGVGALLRAARAAGLAPALTVNGVPHFAESDAMRLSELLGAKIRW